MNIQKHTPAETFDEYQNKYNDTVNNAVSFTGLNVDFFTKVKAGYLLELAKENLGPTKDLSALDIGCGVGNFHPLLQNEFSALHGVDVSGASIERAAANNPDVKYESYDGMRLPYADASFDLAFTICVVHHVPPANWKNFAAEMHRVLRPGGLALVFEHNPQNPLTMRAVNSCPFDEDAVLLRSKETISLMSGAGFSDVKARFILSIPAGNGFLRKIDRVFSKIPFGAQYYVSAKRS